MTLDPDLLSYAKGHNVGIIQRHTEFLKSNPSIIRVAAEYKYYPGDIDFRDSVTVSFGHFLMKFFSTIRATMTGTMSVTPMAPFRSMIAPDWIISSKTGTSSKRIRV